WRYGVPGDMEILEIWSSWRYGDPGDSRPHNMVALPRRCAKGLVQMGRSR
nr:hypothetical protein [Tanacetum cinerariifolium]